MKKTSKRANKETVVPNIKRPFTTIDLAIFAVRDVKLNVLLVNRPKTANDPFPGSPALPGGFIDIDKDPDLLACANRKLLEKTKVEANYLEQVGSVGNGTRDPRGWSATHVYFALIPCVDEQNLSKDAYWMPVDNAINRTKLAFDHSKLLLLALDRLRSKVEYTSLPAYLLTPPFTLPQLQQIYEVVLDRQLDKSSFRTRTLAANYLAETGLIRGDATRPAMGYKIKQNTDLIFFPRPLSGAS